MSTVVYQVYGMSGSDSGSDSSNAYLGYGLADYKDSRKTLVKNRSAAR